MTWIIITDALMYKYQSNVAAGKGGANFNYLLYRWVACEFPPRDQ